MAGLVKGAHEGKGLGNQFLDHLRQASALIHIIDASGSTDAEGNPCDVGTHDPLEDVAFLEDEIALWIREILSRDFRRKSKQMEQGDTKLHVALAERLTGLAISENQVFLAMRETDLMEKPSGWSDDDLLRLSHKIREISKPLTIAANKTDIAPEENVAALMGLKDKGYHVWPICAEVELALSKAGAAGIVEYELGATTFTIGDDSKLNDAQRKGLETMAALMEKCGGTGVTPLIEDVAFNTLDLMVVSVYTQINPFASTLTREIPGNWSSGVRESSTRPDPVEWDRLKSRQTPEDLGVRSQLKVVAIRVREDRHRSGDRGTVRRSTRRGSGRRLRLHPDGEEVAGRHRVEPGLAGGLRFPAGLRRRHPGPPHPVRPTGWEGVRAGVESPRRHLRPDRLLR